MAHNDNLPQNPATASATRYLTSAGFLGLLATQTLGTANDNIFRWLVIGVGKESLEGGNAAGILMAGTVCFVIPYLLLAPIAGYLADRHSKSRVIIACKLAEIVIMIFGIVAILTGQLYGLLLVVALMGGQSALFSPAKSGCIPEMLPTEKISTANGLFGLVTVVATVIGAAIGNVLSVVTSPRGLSRWWITAVVLIGVAIAGWLSSFFVPRLAAADPHRRIPWDAPRQTWRDLGELIRMRPLFRVALGIMFFWSIGTLANLNVDPFAFEGGAVRQTQIIALLLSLVVGIGVGSVLAGVWSAGRVELGILPLGGAGVCASSLMLYTVRGRLFSTDESITSSYLWACFWMVGLGVSAGLFHVPLEAYMQHRSPKKSRGAILAASNFLTFSGILLASVAFWVLRHPWPSGGAIPSADGANAVQGGDGVVSAGVGVLCSPQQVFLICALLTIPVLMYILWLIPQASLRFVVWLLSRIFYRIRIHGLENVPEEGPALIVPNHVSWLDGILVLLATTRPVRMLVFAGNFQQKWLQRLALQWGAIMIEPGPKKIIQALRTANKALKDGELVCIFPEGGITRSGQLLAFRPGILKVLEGSGAPVIPVYLDELWGSIFSFERRRFFWKLPRRLPYPITIYFGTPIENVENVHQIRQAVQELGAEAVQQRQTPMLNVTRAMVRHCKRRKFAPKVADSSGEESNGANALLRTLILRRLLARHVLQSDEQHVGVLLPPSVGGVLVNMALALDQRVSVNLNYTVGSETLNYCISEAGIKHVLTSRRVMSKLDLKLNAELVYLEDLKDKVTLGDKVWSALETFVLPSWWVERSLKLQDIAPDDVATVIFTSGSTGIPKGVMLTYRNVSTNVEAIESAIHLGAGDVVLGILPFFHSFGYTVTMWTPMATAVKGVYHYSPLDAKRIGQLAEKHKVTILLSTPTFLRSFLRRCTPEQFRTIEVIVTGAERLPPALADAFEEKFKVRPVEGYGCTETAPLVSVNIPPSRQENKYQEEAKEGTVGRPVPGVSAKIVHLETGADLGVDQPGMLLIKGPNIMKGYLNQPEKTAEVIRDGWYVTGDVAVIDDDGFIKITGRESRFSKIGGEMVPHVQIEEVLCDLIGRDEESVQKAVVTSVPDQAKGERLVVLHVPITQSPEELRDGLTQAGLPNLFIPSVDSFFEIPAMPILGTGKLDLKEIRQKALDILGICHD